MKANRSRKRLSIATVQMTLIGFVLFYFGVIGQAEPFVINSAGTRVTGSAIQSAVDGTILLTTLNGQRLTFKKGTYRQAVADKPSEMDQIDALLKQRDLEAVVHILNGVKETYRYLGWDQRASLMLARVYLPLNQFDASAREYEALFSVQPTLKQNLKERSNYMQALLGSGRRQEVVAMIDQDIASGSREAAARAQVVRGDMKAADGNYDEALLDYFRTAILFRAQTDVLPEATYKTAVALKKQNDPRAMDYFQKVISDFPETDYADRAREEVNR